MSINENEIEYAAKSFKEPISAQECEWIKQEIYDGTPEIAFARRFKNHALLSINYYCEATGLKRKEVVQMIKDGTLDHYVVNKQVKIPLSLDWFCHHDSKEMPPNFAQVKVESSDESLN